MVVIGITGGSGSGKSCFSTMLSGLLGAPVIDADGVYHALTDAPSPCTAALAQAFGEGILCANGALNRQALAGLVFGDSAEAKRRRQRLNEITHAFVRYAFDEQLSVYQGEGKPFVLLDVPLLFESGFDALCHCTVAVLASYERRLLRIIERDGLAVDAAKRRIDAQPQDAYYLERCDHAIYNNSDAQALQEQAFLLAEKIKRQYLS